MIKSRQKIDDKIKTEDMIGKTEDRGQMTKWRQKTDDQIKTEDRWSNQERIQMTRRIQKTDDQHELEAELHEELHKLRSLSEVTNAYKF